MRVEWGQKGATPSAPTLTDERKSSISSPEPVALGDALIARKATPALDLSIVKEVVQKPSLVGRFANMFSPRSSRSIKGQQNSRDSRQAQSARASRDSTCQELSFGTSRSHTNDQIISTTQNQAPDIHEVHTNDLRVIEGEGISFEDFEARQESFIVAPTPASKSKDRKQKKCLIL